jgi:hypothetical protein
MYYSSYIERTFEKILGYNKEEIYYEELNYLIYVFKHTLLNHFFVVITKEPCDIDEYRVKANVDEGIIIIGDIQDHSYMLNHDLLPDIITILDSNGKYCFLSYVAIEMHVAQYESLHLQDIDTILSKYNLEIDPLEALLDSCPFLIRSKSNNYSFLDKYFKQYYIALEFNKYHRSNYKGRFIHPVGISYIDIDRLPEKGKPLLEIWNQLENKKMAEVSLYRYQEASILRDAQYRLFSDHISRLWPFNEEYDLDEIAKEFKVY